MEQFTHENAFYTAKSYLGKMIELHRETRMELDKKIWKKRLNLGRQASAIEDAQIKNVLWIIGGALLSWILLPWYASLLILMVALTFQGWYIKKLIKDFFAKNSNELNSLLESDEYYLDLINKNKDYYERISDEIQQHFRFSCGLSEHPFVGKSVLDENEFWDLVESAERENKAID